MSWLLFICSTNMKLSVLTAEFLSSNASLEIPAKPVAEWESSFLKQL